MTVSIAFSKSDLVKLEQILAQMIHYAKGNTDAVSGIEEDDISSVKSNAENFREDIATWLNSYSTYDGSSQDASFN
jgi:hypothetical protein